MGIRTFISDFRLVISVSEFSLLRNSLLDRRVNWERKNPPTPVETGYPIDSARLPSEREIGE